MQMVSANQKNKIKGGCKIYLKEKYESVFTILISSMLLCEDQ